jgi:hypothetical protein
VTPEEWSEACIKIREWTQAQPTYVSYYEVHQRIEIYRLSRQSGMPHQEALNGAALNPAANLPHLVFITDETPPN